MSGLLIVLGMIDGHRQRRQPDRGGVDAVGKFLKLSRVYGADRTGLPADFPEVGPDRSILDLWITGATGNQMPQISCHFRNI
jgi:hypothetical protein